MKQSRASFSVVLCGLVAACAVTSGCSSDNAATTAAGTTTGTAGSGGSGGSTGGGAGSGGGSACTAETTMIFSPAYSAYDGENVYKIPLIAYGITGETKWTASDPSMVDLDPDAVDFGDAGVSGKAVMVTTRKAGKVKITATSGSSCGTTELTITQATAALQKVGKDRYNNGVPVQFDGGNNFACSNCHGATTNTMFLDVQHTPQQTGGYTDEEIVNIFTKGQKPANGGCRVINPCSIWTGFHKWAATAEEEKGIVYYLRSLEPAPQGGIDFGGTRPPTRDQ